MWSNKLRTQARVIMHNVSVPLEMMSTKNAAKIAASIGEVMVVENPYVQGQLVRSFIRARVKINVKNPLITGCWVPIKDLPRLWIKFKYEKLQGFCYRCGIIGHDNRRCKKDQAMASFDSSRPKYGPSIGVPPARSISSIVTENLNWVRKLKGHEEVEEREKDNPNDKNCQL
ncbi:Zinc finger, CCHC-type [Sesbania bispinosa]|nr:Zinc finger, CCHC-type [Sesbania bispinosa]